jgi:long-chain acyl-CoA synthetase
VPGSSNVLGNEGFLTLTIKMRVRPEPECEEELVDLLRRHRDALNHSVEKIVEEVGELAIYGPQVMKGYWKMESETAKVLINGWLLTGDMAKMDEDGYFYIVDRKKDMIIAGGYNIYPREVEEVLYEHPAVLEAAVIGVPDPYRGETVKAFIVLKPEYRGKVTAEEIIKFCRERLAAYKVPRIIEFRDELPKSAVGKNTEKSS